MYTDATCVRCFCAGNQLKKHKNRGQPVLPDDTYEQQYEHTAALTVELRNFALFDQLWPLVASHFHRLRLVYMSFEVSDPAPDYWRSLPLRRVDNVDGIESVVIVADDETDSAEHMLMSHGFHVDDTRLGLIFQHWPVEELYVRSPDLEKAALGGGGAGGALEWSGFRGRALCEMGGVRRCELRFCHRVQVQHFQQFAINNAESLRHLVLGECAQLNGSETVFRDIALYLADLRQLHAMFRDVCPPLGRLTELRELRVLELDMASDCDRLLEDLAMNDRLEELHLTDCLVDFTADGMYASGEFFTRLREVSMLGNVLDSRSLARFGGDRLEVLRFAYSDTEMADAVVQIVSESPRLRVIDMYCTKWVTVRLVKRIAVARSANKSEPTDDAAAGVQSERLMMRLTLELFDENDRPQLEDLVKRLASLSRIYAHVINIEIV